MSQMMSMQVFFQKKINYNTIKYETKDINIDKTIENTIIFTYKKTMRITYLE